MRNKSYVWLRSAVSLRISKPQKKENDLCYIDMSEKMQICYLPATNILHCFVTICTHSWTATIIIHRVIWHKLSRIALRIIPETSNVWYSDKFQQLWAYQAFIWGSGKKNITQDAATTTPHGSVTLKTTVLIQSPKISSVEFSQYLVAGSLGNTRSCKQIPEYVPASHNSQRSRIKIPILQNLKDREDLSSSHRCITPQRPSDHYGVDHTSSRSFLSKYRVFWTILIFYAIIFF